VQARGSFEPPASVPSQVIRVRAAIAFATCFGLGYSPFAPGTVGSGVGLVVWVILPQTAVVHAAAILAIFVAGIWSGGVAERQFQATDPAPVIVDEVVGMLVTLFMNPVGWGGALVGFLLFRIFDVLKPYPANRLERLHGGIGVMADDFMAAIYANLALRAILAFS
jgi:phosphatidylglycerophosphatase A